MLSNLEKRLIVNESSCPRCREAQKLSFTLPEIAILHRRSGENGIATHNGVKVSLSIQ